MKLKKILILLLVLGVLLGLGGFVAYRVYCSARQARLIKQARTALEKPNLRKAELALRRALRYNPKDLEACRLMAQLAEGANSPHALLWRSRVVELNPRSNEDRLALAKCSFQFKEYAAATNALAGLDAAGKKTADYHNLAGLSVLAFNQIAQAEAHFQEAARLDPTNPTPQLNLAKVRLYGTNAQLQAEARSAMTRLSAAKPSLRCEILRELILDAVRSGQTNSALAMSKELVQNTNSTFDDRLRRLGVLHLYKNAEFKPTLAVYQRDTGTNLAQVYGLGGWQMEQFGPTNAFLWLTSKPAVVQTNLPVSILIAECRIALQAWADLLAALDKQNWEEREFVRHAFRARALRGQNLAGASKSEWELALKTVDDRSRAGFAMLLRMAEFWKWSNEVEELLWLIVKRFPDDKAAVGILSQMLHQGGRTRPLMMLLAQQLKQSPQDLAVKNNLAAVALLLDAQELKPHELAHELYQQAGTNALFASTYAFSLYSQGKTKEALKVMEKLKPEALQDPAIAGYYGLILKATGSGEKARAYLAWAYKAYVDKKLTFLPEERKLFDRAMAGG